MIQDKMLICSYKKDISNNEKNCLKYLINIFSLKLKSILTIISDNILFKSSDYLKNKYFNIRINEEISVFIQ